MCAAKATQLTAGNVRSTLPANYITIPIRVFVQIAPKNVLRRSGRRMRLAEQLHACRLQHAAALLMIAAAAGRDQVLPAVAATQAARQDMVQRQFHILAATILAGVMVT